MLNTRTAVSALGALVLASPALAVSITQVTVSDLTVTQDIITLQGHPGFYQSAPIDSGAPDPGYIFFDEHVRILNEEARPWDPTQIPSSPLPLNCTNNCGDVPYNVISTGQMTATMTFDADILAAANLLGATGGFTAGGEIFGTELGTTSGAVSTIQIVSGGVPVVGAVSTTTTIFAANDISNGAGFSGDVLAIVADIPTVPGVENSGAILLLAGDTNWFEETGANAIPDFSKVTSFQTDYWERDNSSTGDYPLYEMVISSDQISGSPTFQSFGAADGSAEDAPLLPDGADLSGGTASFEFDLSEVLPEGFVFVDPEIAVGYTYQLQGPGAISAFKAPTLAAVNDPDGYTIVMPDGTEFTILPGAVVDFVAEGFNNVTTFNLTGISEDLMIDPDDATTFVGGFLFSGIGQGSSIAQTALTIDTDAPPPVPLPAGVWFLLTGVAGFGLASRRKSAAA